MQNISTLIPGTGLFDGKRPVRIEPTMAAEYFKLVYEVEVLLNVSELRELLND